MALLRRIDLNFVLVLLLTSFVMAPLARPGFPITAAGFRPVWSLNSLAHCGGWPEIHRASDLLKADGLAPLYAALGFRLLGFDMSGAVKASLALAYAIGSLAIYAWLRCRWGAPAALLAAALYAFLPYRLSVTYVAGGLGNAWVMALYPLAGWALWACSERLTAPRGVLAFLAWALLALSNAGLAVWFTLACAVAFWLMRRKALALLPLAPAALLLIVGLLLAGRIAGTTSADFASGFVYPFQLFSAGWNQAPTGVGWIDAMPFALGLIPLGLAGLALAGLVNGRAFRRTLMTLGVGVVLATFLTTPASSFFWHFSRMDRLLAYPWQMLGLATLGLVLLAGFSARQFGALARWPVLAGVMALALLSIYGNLEPTWTETEPGPSPVAILGNNQIALVDYEIKGEQAPGSPVTLNVVWQCLRPLDKDYTVFFQALDETQRIRGQTDAQPQTGKSPTSSWYPGQIITDTYSLRMDPARPTGAYQMILGLYDWQSGKRLTVGRDDKVILKSAIGLAAVDVAWPCQDGTP